jgi:phage terminase large subunit-like protein
LEETIIAPWQAHAALLDDPAFADFDDLDFAILEADPDFGLRIDQQPPHANYRYLGAMGGRGLGKTHFIAKTITREIDAGRIKKLALLAQHEEITYEVQINDGLLKHCSPWNKAYTFRDKVVWENGAEAIIYTPQAPDGPRGFNGDAAWLTELVGWPEPTRLEAFNNITTAVRIGLARIYWDTTSRGRNELIAFMRALNERDPLRYPIIRGTMFDNPLLGRDYLAEQCIKYTGRQYDEEVLGKSFDEAEGALYEQLWFDQYRVNTAPSRFDLKVVGLDPGVSEKGGVDGCGIVVAGRDGNGHAYVVADRSGVFAPDKYAEILFEEHANGASGVICETNKGGQTHEALIRAIGSMRGIDVRVLGLRDRMPQRSPSIFYFKPVFSRNDKLTRGMGPSALAANGRVHMVGKFPELERQACTYAGEGKSPNNLDAFNQALSELAGLYQEGAPREGREERAKGARAASEQLRARLRAMASGRSVV